RRGARVEVEHVRIRPGQAGSDGPEVARGGRADDSLVVGARVRRRVEHEAEADALLDECFEEAPEVGAEARVRLFRATGQIPVVRSAPRPLRLDGLEGPLR